MMAFDAGLNFEQEGRLQTGQSKAGKYSGMVGFRCK